MTDNTSGLEELADELKLAVIDGTKRAKPNALAHIDALQREISKQATSIRQGA
jgi:hypothetical protein